MNEKNEFGEVWKEFWEGIPWQFKALWAGFGIIILSLFILIFWLIFRFVHII
ncbi:MAG: hypothetical protein AABY22_18585 [Nanoarchaeota archaeon]